MTKNYTYKKLKDTLTELTDEQLEMNVSVLLDGEIYPLNDVKIVSEINEDILDILDNEIYPVLIINEK